MKRIHIVGRKNSGKTTLVVELVEWLTQQGYRVGTIKHTHHHHELDTPGKDSFLHREAGSNAIGILSPAMNAVFWPNPKPTEPGEDDASNQTDKRYQLFQSLMDQCDLVLVEGDSKTTATKLEVWRAENTSEPMIAQDEDFSALITDDNYTTNLPVLRRSDIPALAAWILDKAGVDTNS